MKYLFILAMLAASFASAQSPVKLDFNKSYPDVQLDKNDVTYELTMEKDGFYKFSVQQQGIDVVVIFENGTDRKEKDSPNGSFGLEEFEYKSAVSGKAQLIIRRLEEQGNPEQGKFTITVKKFTSKEIATRAAIKKELASENAKNVQTIGIDHFWQAYDKLAASKTHADSLAIIQTVYLDRATDGLIDFIKVRDFTAEKFVKAVHRFPKFYNAIRKNTYEVKNAAPLIEEVFTKFKALYPNFKPFKVCFAVGVLSTGGTVTDNFVLIGAEISTCTSSIDLSELNNNALSKVMSNGDNVVQKIKDIVAHECVHTQQKIPLDRAAVKCDLLYAVMQEGFADFIGELTSGSQINKVSQAYGDQHEKELWTQLKSEMCSDKASNWLYNFSQVTDKPADLGYYMGYTIAREYYNNAADKKKAVIDIIEMNNPLKFLEVSRYDQKYRER